MDMNELPKLNLTKEEQEHINEVIKEMEQQLIQALRDGYVDGTPIKNPMLHRAKPLSKEDIDNFRREWEKWQ
jgi:hypothetical protein